MTLESTAKLTTVAEPFVVAPKACLDHCRRLAREIIMAASPLDEQSSLYGLREPAVEVVVCHASGIKARLPFVCGARTDGAGSITEDGRHIGSVIGHKSNGRYVNGNTEIEDAFLREDQVLRASEALVFIRSKSQR